MYRYIDGSDCVDHEDEVHQFLIGDLKGKNVKQITLLGEHSPDEIRVYLNDDYLMGTKNRWGTVSSDTIDTSKYGEDPRLVVKVYGRHCPKEIHIELSFNDDHEKIISRRRT
jgi:hypothetical protein